MSNLISIVIPIYNVEKYLKHCIDSVLTQTYKNIEIILVNDGSTDESRVICEKYVVSDSRIKLINKRNGGLSDARNAGIAQAKGEYLAFVDSDDYLHELFIEKMHSKIKSDNSDICMCTYHFVNEGEEDYSAMKSIPDTYDYRMEGLSEGVHTSDTVMKHISNTRLTVLWNKLYRRDLFDNLSFPVGLLHEDEFVLHRIFAKSHNVSVISDKLYFYLQRSSSIIGQPYSARRLGILDAYTDRIDFYINNQRFEFLRCTCIGYIRQYVKAHILLPKSKENFYQLKERKKIFIGYWKIMLHYGGAYVGVRFLLAATSPKLSNTLLQLLHRSQNN